MNFIKNDSVLVSLPSHDDHYYSHNYRNIIKFYYELITVVSQYHDVIVISDQWSASTLKSCGSLSPRICLSISHPVSPWIRDYFPILGKTGLVKPTYSPSYQNQFESASVDA